MTPLSPTFGPLACAPAAAPAELPSPLAPFEDPAFFEVTRKATTATTSTTTTTPATGSSQPGRPPLVVVSESGGLLGAVDFFGRRQDVPFQ